MWPMKRSYLKIQRQIIKMQVLQIEERDSFKKYLLSHFVDTYRTLYPEKVEYSWWSYRFKAREKNAGWRIDYWLVSPELKDKIVDAKILTDVYGSDHCPVELDVEV